jgi:hypothetical protein
MASFLAISSFHSLSAQPSESASNPPARKIIDEHSIDYLDFRALRFHLHNAVEHYQYANSQLAVLARQNQMLQDSVDKLNKQSQKQLLQIIQLNGDGHKLKSLQNDQKASRDSLRRQMAQLTYERQLVTDPRVMRVYKFPLAEVRRTLVDNLTKTDSDLRYEGGNSANMLVMKREFNERNGAWWPADKNVDALLEVTLRLVEHQYDNSRTVVYGDVRLLQKDRNTDKVFDDQSDPEKTTLYRNRALRSIEGFLRTTSEK